MTTQQLNALAPALSVHESPARCRTCQAPAAGLSPRTRRCAPCADRKSLEREAAALIAGGATAIALGGALLGFLATQIA